MMEYSVPVNLEEICLGKDSVQVSADTSACKDSIRAVYKWISQRQFASAFQKVKNTHKESLYKIHVKQSRKYTNTAK